MKYIFIFIACLGQCKCQNNNANFNNTSSIPKDSASVVKELFRQDSLLSTHEGKGVFKLLTDNRYIEYKVVRRDSLPVKYDTIELTANESGLYQVNIPLGSRYEIAFVDGTKVWLNAGTTFRFKNNENPYAEISGEAYLRCKRKWVVNASEHTFTIPAGAAINIRCYLSEMHKASMLVGTAFIDSIKIFKGALVEFSSTPHVKNDYLLDDLDDPISWTNGLLSFVNKSCEEGFRELKRWQTNVNISSGSNCLNGGKLNLSMKLRDIINLYEFNNFKISYRVDSSCSIIVK